MLKESFKEQLFSPTCQESAPKLTQNGKIKAQVFEWEPESIFPVNPLANGIGSLSIRQPFDKLQDRHQSQPPWRFGWLPSSRKERSKDVILKHLAQLIAYPQAEIPFGANDVREPSGFFWECWQSFRFERHILASFSASVIRFLRFVRASVFLFSFSHLF
jgi:hypothetical protein